MKLDSTCCHCLRVLAVQIPHNKDTKGVEHHLEQKAMRGNSVLTPTKARGTKVVAKERTKVGQESFPNSFWAVTIQTWTCMVVAFASIFRMANALMQRMELNAQRDGICAVAKDASHRILRRTMTRRSDARAASAN